MLKFIKKHWLAFTFLTMVMAMGSIYGPTMISAVFTDASGDPISTSNPLPVESSLCSIVDDLNSTNTALPADTGGADHIYTGSAKDILGCGIVFVSIYTDAASALDGLCLEQSTDSTNWDYCDAYTIEAGEAKNFSLNPHAKYYRVTYTNGAVAQTVFRLQSICKGGNTKPSSHRVKDDIVGNDDCELVKSAITGINGEDKWHNARVNAAGVLLTSDFLLEVQKGNVPGHSVINKFGHNAETTSGEDVWSGGGVYGFYPTTAQAMEIVSNSVADAVTGIGARTVIIYGLDGNGDEINETKTLLGTAAVDLDNTYTCVYRAVCLTAGSSGTNVGTINIQVDEGGLVAAVIAPGEGQTQMTPYTVPNNHSAYFIKGYVGLGNSDKNGVIGTFQWKSRLGGVGGAWAVKGQMNVFNIGASTWQYEYGAPAGPFPAGTNIKISVSYAEDESDAIGGYDLLLVEDGY